MPINNIGTTHFTVEQKDGINAALTQLFALTENMTGNYLSPAERSKYGKVGEQGKLLINMVKEYRESQPELSSPEIDWEEFNRDYQDRKFTEAVLLQLASLQDTLLSVKILRDHDNKTDALRDYQYAKYKSLFATQSGFASKAESMKQFFPKTGKRKKEDN